MLGVTGSVRELANARALDTVIVDVNGDPVTFTTTAPPATATLTSVPSSVTSVVLLASNASRKKFHIVNDSSKTLKIAFAATASATSFTVLLASQASYESELNDYTGTISGIWSAANGSARITEVTI